MSRDDSLLYTGLSSASFAPPRTQEVKERQDKQKQERLEQQQQLKPVAENILKAIDTERDQTIARLLSMVAPGIPDEDVKSLIISLNLYRESMSKLSTHMKIIVKDLK